ncbi:EcpB family pilus assembly chaperone, partial [Klebsiella pneumoniae]
ISYGPCRDKAKDEGQGCRERYYVMPGVSVKIKHTDLTNKKTRIGIWHGEQYINVN